MKFRQFRLQTGNGSRQHMSVVQWNCHNFEDVDALVKLMGRSVGLFEGMLLYRDWHTDTMVEVPYLTWFVRDLTNNQFMVVPDDLFQDLFMEIA